jgi:hypothetical protein
MLDFDVKMRDYAMSCGGAYCRYCNDILLLLPPGDVLVQREDEVEKLVEGRTFRPAGGDLQGVRSTGSGKVLL